MPGWTFDAFSPPALERLFARPSAEEKDALRALGREAAEKALGRGRLSYEGLAVRERVALDRFVKALFDDDALAPTLERRRHGVAPLEDEDAALLADGADLEEGGCLLRLLISGRRLGLPDMPLGGTYVVFSEDEVAELLNALRTSLGRSAFDGPTTTLVRTKLVPMLERTGRGCALYGALDAEETDELDRLVSSSEAGKLTKGTAQHARHQLWVEGNVDAALATLATLAEKGSPTTRERTIADLVDLCARYGRIDEARRWQAKLG